MNTEPQAAVIEAIRSELCEQHGCHTVILYGSRARGDFTVESDYDLIGIHEGERKVYREARWVDDACLDLFVHPEADFQDDLVPFLKLRGGRILMERAGFGVELLARIEAVFDAGPTRISPDEDETIRVWIEKMLRRISKGDTEGNYRRAWLQYDLLESYFSLRGLWYRGPKEAFRWLEANDPVALALFSAALQPGANEEWLRRLAKKVLATK